MGYAVIEAPSVLGLFPRGVERLPDALLDAGLAGDPALPAALEDVIGHEEHSTVGCELRRLLSRFSWE